MEFILSVDLLYLFLGGISYDNLSCWQKLRDSLNHNTDSFDGLFMMAGWRSQCFDCLSVWYARSIARFVKVVYPFLWEIILSTAFCRRWWVAIMLKRQPFPNVLYLLTYRSQSRSMSTITPVRLRYVGLSPSMLHNQQHYFRLFPFVFLSFHEKSVILFPGQASSAPGDQLT